MYFFHVRNIITPSQRPATLNPLSSLGPEIAPRLHQQKHPPLFPHHPLQPPPIIAWNRGHVRPRAAQGRQAMQIEPGPLCVRLARRLAHPPPSPQPTVSRRQQRRMAARLRLGRVRLLPLPLSSPRLISGAWPLTLFVLKDGLPEKPGPSASGSSWSLAAPSPNRVSSAPQTTSAPSCPLGAPIRPSARPPVRPSTRPPVHLAHPLLT